MTSRPRPARTLAGLTAGLLSIGLLAACGSSSDAGDTSSAAASPVAESSSAPEPAATSAESPATADPSEPAATASGTITVYSGRNEDLVAPLLEQFTTDTGIEVQVRYAGSGELGAQLLTEGGASPADVFLSQDAGALGAVAKSGLFAPIDETTLAAVPAEFSAADGTWTGVSGRARTIVYNPTLAPTPPDTIEGVLDPQWKGKIGYAPSNASWQAFVTGLRLQLGEDGARTWLEGFKAQEPVAFEKNGQIRDAVNAGEIPLGLVNHYYLHELVSKQGAENVTAQNQFFAAGDPGGLINVAGVGVLASATNPDGAQAFAAYLVSPSAQEYFATETGEYPLIAGVEVESGAPALADLSPPAVDLSDLDDLEATQQLLVEVGLLTT